MVQSYLPHCANVPPCHMLPSTLGWVETSNGILIGLAIFAQLTAEFFPLKIAPLHGGMSRHLIHCSLSSPEPTTPTASQVIQPYCTAHGRVLLGMPAVPRHVLSIKTAPLHLDSHSIHGSLGPPGPITQTASQSVQLFAQLMSECRHSAGMSGHALPLKIAPFHG